ncbi:Hypothetical Protein RSKD131_1999 [Cereibacter sphaeroides KD131]|nr:Hypothetical Protein RSKD131_1999 [Cereibacter sphaeroides KD131]
MLPAGSHRRSGAAAKEAARRQTARDKRVRGRLRRSAVCTTLPRPCHPVRREKVMACR